MSDEARSAPDGRYSRVGAIPEIARYETARRLRGTLTLSALLAALSLLFVAFFPSLREAGLDLDEYIEAMPPAMQATFGVASLSTIEGFLVVEVYQFLWVIFLGLYFGYLGGGLVAADRERRRLDLLLAAPVSRARVVVEKYLTLLAPAILVNAVVAAAVYAGVRAIGETVSVADLLALHALSIPYFLACGAIGLAASVLVADADVARRLGIGAVFGLFLVDSLTRDTDYEPVGALGPSRYYDPAEILVSGTYDLAGAAILLVGAVALVGIAAAWFRRADLT